MTAFLFSAFACLVCYIWWNVQGTRSADGIAYPVCVASAQCLAVCCCSDSLKNHRMRIYLTILICVGLSTLLRPVATTSREWRVENLLNDPFVTFSPFWYAAWGLVGFPLGVYLPQLRRMLNQINEFPVRNDARHDSQSSRNL